MKSSMIYAVLCYLIFFSVAATAAVSLDVDNIRLSDAVRLFAGFLKVNVIVSPAVKGRASLHLHEADARQAFDMLLAGQQLAKWQEGGVIMVAPREDLIKMRQEEARWQMAQEKSEAPMFSSWQLKYARAHDVAHILQDEHHSLLSSGGRIRTDPRTNTLFIRDSARRIALAGQLIKRLDVPVKQILIETRLASVDSDFKRELGIQFLNHSGSQHAGAETKAMQAGIATSYSLAVAKLADGSLLDVKLSALENAGHAELISAPSLFTANQQTASIEAGEEVPYQEVSESGGTAVMFKKAVLGLKVTPQLLPGNKVLLKLHINQDRPSSHLVLGVPTISTRQMTTNVLIANGQTVVLGGIFETTQEQDEEKLPFISEVPLIGELFKQRAVRRSKRELLIFVTPRIIE